MAAHDPKRARERLEEFLRGNPERAARVVFELGRLDVAQGLLRDGVEKFKRSISLDDSQSGPVREALASPTR